MSTKCWPIVLLAALACSDTPTQPLMTVASVSGQYLLAAVNGDSLPCCATTVADSVVKTESWGSSLLVLLPDSTYTWEVTLRFDWRDGHSHYTELRDSLVASGTFSISPAGVQFEGAESAMIGTFFGAARRYTFTVVHDHGHYVFARTPSPNIVGDWIVFGCTDLLGNSPGCPTTDSAGAVSTILTGDLHFSGDSARGQYQWTNQISVTFPDSTSTIEERQFSVGTYMWDDATLILTDSSGSRPSMLGGYAGNSHKLSIRTDKWLFDIGQFLSIPRDWVQ